MVIRIKDIKEVINPEAKVTIRNGEDTIVVMNGKSLSVLDETVLNSEVYRIDTFRGSIELTIYL